MISGGFNVYAREVEDALQSHPAVAEAAVLGLPDPEWGEVVAAFVVRRPGQQVDADELKRHCGELIAGYKKPRIVEFVDALPRNHTSKVTKNILRDAYLSRQGAISK
jgi:acyl-CoA synthetase (AMP-forming)/AMP-acid ligase II